MDTQSEPKLIEGFQWIVYDPDLLGGKPTVKDTRLSVSLILGCLAEGMTPEEIAGDYPGFPIEAVPDVLRFAAQQTEKSLNDQTAAA